MGKEAAKMYSRQPEQPVSPAGDNFMRGRKVPS